MFCAQPVVRFSAPSHVDSRRRRRHPHARKYGLGQVERERLRLEVRPAGGLLRGRDKLPEIFDDPHLALDGDQKRRDEHQPDAGGDGAVDHGAANVSPVRSNHRRDGGGRYVGAVVKSQQEREHAGTRDEKEPHACRPVNVAPQRRHGERVRQQLGIVVKPRGHRDLNEGDGEGNRHRSRCAPRQQEEKRGAQGEHADREGRLGEERVTDNTQRGRR